MEGRTSGGRSKDSYHIYPSLLDKDASVTTTIFFPEFSTNRYLHPEINNRAMSKRVGIYGYQ